MSSVSASTDSPDEAADRVRDGRHLMPNDERPQCDACGSPSMAKVKGCIRCLHCGYKADCNGW